MFGTLDDDLIYGLGADDTLYGDDGDDYLDSGAGADEMHGGEGNDIYVVDDAGDVVIEGVGLGTDLVLSSISYTLTSNVENLRLTGAANLTGASTLYGGDGNDEITGNSSSSIDMLYGGNGDDYLKGGAGYNTLEGGLGADRYYLTGSSNTLVFRQADMLDAMDTIVGFWPIDRLQLEIPGLAPGVLSGANFINDTASDSFTGNASGDGSPKVILTNWNGTIHDQGTNYLWVDFDGSGAQLASNFANIGTETATASQITII